MKTRLPLILLLLAGFFPSRAQAPDSVIIYYFENYPYAYTEAGTPKGIEVDILAEYVNWLKQKKDITVKVSYKPFREFSTFYSATRSGSPRVIGMGSVTDNPEREKEVSFSPPYLQNVAVLVTDGKVPTIRTKSQAEVSSTLGNLSAITVNNSSHVNYINDVKKTFLPNLKVSFTETQKGVLEKIAGDKAFFGYADIVAYWAYLKANPNKFLKIQKVFTEPREHLAYVMPKNSLHANYLSEFFESGFGFTSTKTYRQILENYLGYEIIESVEIK